MTTQAQPHGYVTRTIHWVSGGLIGFGYLKGLDSVSQLSDPALLRFEVGYALLLGAVFVLRYFWTKSAGNTRLPDGAPRWEHGLSRAVHLGLYAGVFGIILSGLAIAAAYALPGMGFLIGGAVALHEFFLAALPILLALHIAGALWHKFIRRDGVLESMTGRLVAS